MKILLDFLIIICCLVGLIFAHLSKNDLATVWAFVAFLGAIQIFILDLRN